MAFEVIDGTGQLRVADLRRRLGKAFQNTRAVEIRIAPGKASPIFQGTVLLKLVPGGRGLHRRLICPRCETTRQLLQVSPRGELACISCLNIRSRRQRERTCHSWTSLGGQLEDEILRLLLKPGPPTIERLQLAEQKMLALTRADHRRADALLTEAKMLDIGLGS